MNVAKQQFKQSYVLVPVFFSVSGGLTLIAAGGAYAMNSLNHIAKPCFITGLTMVIFSIVYSLAMVIIVPYIKRLCQRNVAQKQQTATSVEDGLSTYSEEVLAADGEGIAFGPKRRRRTSKDTLADLWMKETRDSHRDSNLQAVHRGSLTLPSLQQGLKDLGPRKSLRASRQSTAGHPMDIGEQNWETADFDTGTENFQPEEGMAKYTQQKTSSNTEGI